MIHISSKNPSAICLGLAGRVCLVTGEIVVVDGGRMTLNHTVPV